MSRRRCWSRKKGTELQRWYEEMQNKGIFDSDEEDEADGDWCRKRHYVWLMTG